MDDLLRLLDAAEAAYEQNPCSKTEEWVEDILEKIFGYNLGTTGTNKPLKTPIKSNKISKITTLKMAIKKALKPLF